jgi:hypothetical protein
MTAPVPPGRVQAPPLTAAEAERVARFDAAPDLDLTAEARVERVARAIADSLDGGPFSDREWQQAFDEGVREMYREAAAAAIAADDAWRAEQAGGLRERIAEWLFDTFFADADELPEGWLESKADALLAGPLAALAPADHEPAAAIQRVLISVEAAELSIAHGLPVDWSEFLAAIRAAVSGVQPAATEPGQVTAAEWLDALDQAHAAATPGPWITDGHELYAAHSVELGIPSEWVAETCDVDDPQRGVANAAAIVAEHNAWPRVSAALRAVLALADEDDARRGDYGYRIRNGLDPSPGDRIRTAVVAALGVETTEAGR